MSRPDYLLPVTIAALTTLVAMVAITAVTGVSQETFEIVRASRIYADDLRASAGPLRALFGIDSAFLVLYATLLVTFARRIATPETAGMIRIAIGAVLVTALLDMVEDHFVLAMLRGAERGSDPSAAQIAFEHTVSQVKFNISYLALFVLGLHVPRATRAGSVLAWLLTAGTLVQGAWLFAAPDAWLPAGNVGRWIGFLIGFGLIAKLSRHPRAGGAGAIGAPA